MRRYRFDRSGTPGAPQADRISGLAGTIAGTGAAADYQSYRQGEWAEAQPEKKSFWQKVGEWLQQHVVQPVQQVTATIVNALKPPQTAGSYKVTALAKDDEPPWWKWWKGIKTFVQEKIIAPVQQTWNQYVYQPIIQPTIHWWREDVPGWMKETALSLIPIVGDGWGLIRQGLNWAQKKPVDKLDVILSLAGLVLDFPWPQEGGVGGDITIAILKGMNAAIPPGPAREVLTQLVKEGLKNPDELARILKASEALLKNDRLLKALIDHPQVLRSVMRHGPEAVEILEKYGDEAVKLTNRFGDNALKYLLEGGKQSFENLKFLDSLPGNPERILIDLTSGSPSSYRGAMFQLEQLKKLDPATIKGVEVTIPGGRADVILNDGTIIEYKSWSWYARTYQDPEQLQRIQRDILRQVRAYIDYQNAQGIKAPIKIVFESNAGMPEWFRQAIEATGAIVEAP